MKPTHFGLILLVLFLFLGGDLIAQKDSGLIGKRPVIIFQNKKHPGKFSTLPLPALVWAKLKPHTRARLYILRGGKDSMLCFNRMRHPFFGKIREDSIRINVPFDSIKRIEFNKTFERGGKKIQVGYSLFLGAALAGEIAILSQPNNEQTGKPNPKSGEEIGIYFAIYYPLSVVANILSVRNISSKRWVLYKNEKYQNDEKIVLDHIGRNVLHNDPNWYRKDEEIRVLVLQNKRDTLKTYTIREPAAFRCRFSPEYYPSTTFLGHDGDILKFRLIRKGSNYNDSVTMIIPFDSISEFTLNWTNHFIPKDWKIISERQDSIDKAKEVRNTSNSDNSIMQKPIVVFQNKKDSDRKRRIYSEHVCCIISPKYRSSVILLGCKDSVLTLKVRYSRNWVIGEPDSVTLHIPFDSIKRIDYNISPKKWRIISYKQDSMEEAARYKLQHSFDSVAITIVGSKRDTAKMNHQYKLDPSDSTLTTVVYRNKDSAKTFIRYLPEEQFNLNEPHKVSINVGIGSTDMPYYFRFPYGSFNPEYYQSNPPYIYSLSFGYGITQRMNLGIDFGYFLADYQPIVPSPGLKSGNISTLNVEFRLRSTLFAWKYFYYGFNAGPSFWMAKLNDSIYNKIPSKPIKPQFDLYGVLGFRYNFAQEWMIYGEFDIGAPTILQAGISFFFDPPRRVTQQKKIEETTAK